jgi:hypothetical protein
MAIGRKDRVDNAPGPMDRRQRLGAELRQNLAKRKKRLRLQTESASERTDCDSASVADLKT